MHVQEMVAVTWVLGEGDRDICRIGIRERVFEPLHEIDRTAVALRWRHGDGKVTALVGVREERLRKASLNPEARAGGVFRRQSAHALGSVAATLTVRIALPKLKAWNGTSGAGRSLEAAPGRQAKLGTEPFAVLWGDLRMGQVSTNVTVDVVRIDNALAPNADQDAEGAINDETILAHRLALDSVIIPRDRDGQIVLDGIRRVLSGWGFSGGGGARGDGRGV